MKEPLFLQPVFKERIWGGKALSDVFGYHLPSDKTGECWGISGHPNGPSIVKNGEFRGMSLIQLWDEKRELFAYMSGETFPILVKIIDANDDLSVQVHPGDDYAQQVEGEPYGKMECWYIIDCDEGTEIVYGHRAETDEQFAQMVSDGRWDELLQKIKIRPGDFIYVPSGTVHALGAGALVLETQQNSNVTYRLYDYERLDSGGSLRELHIERALDVVTVPHRVPILSPQTVTRNGMTIKRLISENFFTVYHCTLDGLFSHSLFEKGIFLLVTVLSGSGEIIIDRQSFPFQKGDHFILPATIEEYFVEGDATAIVSHPTLLK